MTKPLKTQILDYLQQQARMVSLDELVEHTQAEPSRVRLWLNALIRTGKVFELQPDIYSFITPVEIVICNR
jgi:DNA-binding IclR family transcriptional regulator